MLLPAIVFCLSFTVVFVALGMTATGLGSTLQDSRDTLDVVAGVVIIALGLLFVITPFVPRLNREWRPDALISPRRLRRPARSPARPSRSRGPRASAPRSARSSPPPAAKDTVGEGALLLACYSAGLAVPFMLTAVAFTRATDGLPLAARPLDDRDRRCPASC